MYPYILADENGHLMPIASITKVLQKDKEIVSKILSSLKELIGDNLRSVILRGSVACGQAIEKISDLDIIIFPYQYTENQKVQVEDLSRKLSPNLIYRYCLVDLSYVDFIELDFKEKNTRMLMNIKLVGITIYGEDVIKLIKPFKVSLELATRIYNQTIYETEYNLELLSTGIGDFFYMGVKRSVDFFCVWMMRVICRGLIAPVMLKSPLFTLNVEASGNEYIRFFPEHKIYIEQMLEWEKHPIYNSQIIVLHVKQFLPLYKKLCNDLGIAEYIKEVR